MTSTPGHQKLVNVHLFISHRPLSNKSGLMARIQLLTKNGQIEKNKRIFKVLISRRFFKSLLSIENNEHPVKKKMKDVTLQKVTGDGLRVGPYFSYLRE